jgi:hypothetical protein
MSYVHHFLGTVHLFEYSPWNAAYLDKATYKEDLDVENCDFGDDFIARNRDRGFVKFYA